jgi:hypothetical protein
LKAVCRLASKLASNIWLTSRQDECDPNPALADEVDIDFTSGATDVFELGVSVTVLCPGPVKTEFGEAAGLDPAESEAALPKIMWLSAEDVAKAALDGLDKGRPVVIPGTANRLTARASQITPKRLLLPILARQHPALRDPK